MRFFHLPAEHRLEALTAYLLSVSSLLVLSVVVISVGKMPGRMQLTRILILYRHYNEYQQIHYVEYEARR
jgi:hypothetical protein